MAFQWLATPSGGAAANLSLEERLLERAEPVVRTWESSREYVVLGQAGIIERDVHFEECQRAGVPILRRSSGGGAVVLGPGCLNYSLVIPLRNHPQCVDVRLGMEWILGRIVKALAVPGLELAGDSDLALDGRKVSGNAQRRTRDAVLHHGTLLYAFDAARAERFLKPPARQPAYRTGRTHIAFLGNLSLSADELSARVREEWC